MQVLALAMAVAYASELGYNRYNDYGYGYNNYGHHDIHYGYDNHYGYNNYGYGYDSHHRLHRRAVFLPAFVGTKGLLALAKVPFPIGK